MTIQTPNPDLYSHVRVVISIIVGLCITTLLGGFARFVQHPRRERVSILHLGWAASLLLWIIHFWWWEFRLSMVQQWNLTNYFFVILYAILFFFLCTLLFPSDIKDYAGYEDYFLSRRKWFFGFLAATFLADVIDTSLKGSAYLHSFGIEYPIRIVAKPDHLRDRNVHQQSPHPARPPGRVFPLSHGPDRSAVQYAIAS